MKVRLSCQNVCLSKMKVVAKVCTCCRKPEWTSCQGVHQSVQLSSKITVEVANVSHKRGKSTGGSSFWEPGYRLETGNFVVHTQYGKQLLGALGPIRATLSQSLKPIQSACSPSLWIKFHPSLLVIGSPTTSLFFRSSLHHLPAPTPLKQKNTVNSA